MTKTYNSLREKISASKAERAEREAEFQALYDLAQREGYQAGKMAKPCPMRVVEADIFGKPKEGAQVWIEEEGMCGFAWVVLRGNTAFGRWLKKNNLASKGYNGGLHIWIGAHNQSIERKTAHASAMANVFIRAGILAYYDSRLD